MYTRPTQIYVISEKQHAVQLLSPEAFIALKALVKVLYKEIVCAAWTGLNAENYQCSVKQQQVLMVFERAQCTVTQ